MYARNRITYKSQANPSETQQISDAPSLQHDSYGGQGMDDSHHKYGIFLVYHEAHNVPPTTHEALPGLQNSDTFSVLKEVCPCALKDF